MVSDYEYVSRSQLILLLAAVITNGLSAMFGPSSFPDLINSASSSFSHFTKPFISLRTQREPVSSDERLSSHCVRHCPAILKILSMYIVAD